MQAMPCDISPRSRAILASVAMIIYGSGVTIRIFKNTTASVIHVIQLYILDAGSSKHSRKMFHGILGKAVADEENLQFRIGLRRKFRLFRADKIGNVGQCRFARTLLAEIILLGFISVLIIDTLAAIVRSYRTSGNAVAPRCQAIVISPEKPAILIVSLHLAIVGTTAELAVVSKIGNAAGSGA